MGKRSNFVRSDRDFYPTPYEGVVPLRAVAETNMRYWEPCAGRGDLIDNLQGFAQCVVATEKYPGCSPVEGVYRGDAMTVGWADIPSEITHIISNTPWDRPILHAMIDLFSSLRPTWLLLDADWKYTKQSAPYMAKCASVIAVGRVKWIPDSKHTGKDNCAWYLFDAKHSGGIQFIPRAA